MLWVAVSILIGLALIVFVVILWDYPVWRTLYIRNNITNRFLGYYAGMSLQYSNAVKSPTVVNVVDKPLNIYFAPKDLYRTPSALRADATLLEIECTDQVVVSTYGENPRMIGRVRVCITEYNLFGFKID